MSGKQQQVFWGHFGDIPSSALWAQAPQQKELRRETLVHFKSQGPRRDFRIWGRTRHHCSDVTVPALSAECYLLRHCPGSRFHRRLCSVSSVLGNQLGPNRKLLALLSRRRKRLCHPDERKASLASMMKVMTNTSCPWKSGRPLHPQPYVSYRAMWCLFPAFPDYLESIIIIIFHAN